jgi:hypothetical protein
MIVGVGFALLSIEARSRLGEPFTATQTPPNTMTATAKAKTNLISKRLRFAGVDGAITLVSIDHPMGEG